MAFVDPKQIYSNFYAGLQPLIPDYDPTGKIKDPSGASTPAPPAAAPSAPGTPAAPAVSADNTYGKDAGFNYSDLWTKLLKGFQATGTGNPEAGKDWAMTGNDKYWRTRLRGFDLFGLVPQELYWQNLAGSGSSVEDAIARGDWEGNVNNTIHPASWWSQYANQSAGLPDWLKMQLDMLKGQWGGLSDAEKNIIRGRLYEGTGLPAYLQAFVKARPKWITDYEHSLFG